MFDTHCHLQFGAFEQTLPEVIKRAVGAGVSHIMVPGTDVPTSEKAIEIAKRLDGQMVKVYAAVGVHPHHVYEYQIQKSIRQLADKSQNDNSKIKSELKEIEVLLNNEKVVAVGEIGVDRFYYRRTKYTDYQVTEEFIGLQKEVLKAQMLLALKYKKSLILHNREAVKDLLDVLDGAWAKEFSQKTVFHCCEPEEQLLKFAKENDVFIGVDGDVTYDKKKQDFIRNVPLEQLVLETDSPFLIPEPLKSEKVFPNEPKNLALTVEFLTTILPVSKEKLITQTTENAKQLFNL